MAEGRRGESLQIGGGEDAFEAYLALPDAGHGPGLIVLQEWWGLVPHIRDVCDRFARSGYVALAPDLYHGDRTTDPDVAGRLMMDLEVERAGRDLVAAVEALLRRPETDGPRIGCIGFCMGGQLALYAAGITPRIGAVVDCYGIHPNVTPDYDAIEARVFGVFAEHDEFVSAADVERLREALERAGVEATLRIYPGVQHAFLNETRPDVHDAARAAEAWRDIDAFFDATLR